MDVGGGRKFKLPLSEKFLMPQTQRVWGPKIKILRASCLLSFVYHSLTIFLFDIDTSSAWRDIKHLEPIVKQCMPILEKMEAKIGKICKVDELMKFSKIDGIYRCRSRGNPYTKG